MPRITTTQFILIIILNVLLFGFWYFTTPVRIVKQDRPVYKDKIVKVNDKASLYNQIIEKVDKICEGSFSKSSDGVQSFSLDKNNKPVFQCHY